MTECPICFLNDWVSKSPCGHLICLSCLIQLRKDECPSCRRPLNWSLPPIIKSIVKSSTKHNTHLNIHSTDEFPPL
jgi:hypothetical protein